MGMGLLITGIIIGIIFAIAVLIILAIKCDELAWWKTALLLFLLGIMALIFVGLGIWLS